MAKPINPYQGPAPAAMSRMGEGIMEAGANIGRSLQSGYEALGKGIGSGITALAGAYSDYKKMESGVKGAEKSYEMFRPYLNPELRTQFDNQIASINSDKSLSLQDKAAFWDQTKGFIGGAINQQFALQKQQQEINAAAARQATAMQNEIYIKQLDALNEAKKYEYAAGAAAGAGVGSFGGFGAKPSKAVDLNKRFSFGVTE